MAQPYIQPSNDPNYLGFTREIQPPPVDQTYGKLFENIGNLLGQGAKGVDTLIEDSAKRDARKIIQERIQAPYTDLSPPEAAGLGNIGSRANAKAAAQAAGSLTDTGSDAEAEGTLPYGARPIQAEGPLGKGGLFDFLAGKDQEDVAQTTPNGPDVRSPMAALRGESEVPPQVQGEIDNQMGQLEKLQKGRNVGIISPTYLYTQYTAAAKALYSKYPGYEDVIDSEFHKLTGVVPANAQIHAIWQDFNNLEAGTLTAKQKWDAEVKTSAAQVGMGGAAAAQGYAAYGDPQKMLQFRMLYQDLQKSHVDQQREEMALKIGTLNHTVTENDQKQQLVVSGNRVIGRFMQEWRSADGSTFGELTNRLFEFSKKEDLSPDNKRAVEVTLNQVNTMARQALAELYRGDQFSTIDGAWKKQAEEQVIAPITALADAWSTQGTKGLAIAGIVQRHLENMATASGDEIVKSSSLAQMWTGLAKAGGAGGAQALVPIFMALTSGQTKDAQGRPIPPIDKMTSDAIQTMMLHGVNNQGDFFKDAQPKTPMIQGQKPTGDATPEALNAKIHAVTDIISGKNVPDNMKANTAAYLATKGATQFVLSFKPEEQAKVLAQLTTPAVTVEVYRMGQSNPALWDQYKNWAKDSLLASVADSRGDINSMISRFGVHISWNPKTSQLDVDPIANWKGPEGQTVPIPLMPQDLKAVANFNLALKSIQGIYAKTGENISDKLVPSLGLNIPGYAPTKEATPQPVTPPVEKTNLQPEGKTAALTVNPAAPPAKQLTDYAESKQNRGNFDVAENRFKPNQATVGDKWGDPFAADFKEKHLSPVTAGGHTVLVNKVAAQAFQGFLKDLESTGYQIKALGGFDIRSKKGNADQMSQHSLGNAIDINPSSNPFGSSKSDMPPQVANLARKWGLSWGGQWKSTRDPMHFEYSGKK